MLVVNDELLVNDNVPTVTSELSDTVRVAVGVLKIAVAPTAFGTEFGFQLFVSIHAAEEVGTNVSALATDATNVNKMIRSDLKTVHRSMLSF
jgi:hypothetical protein